MKPAERISRKGWRAALVGQPTGRRSTHRVEAVVGRRRRLALRRELLRLAVETAAPAPGRTEASGNAKTPAGATARAFDNNSSTL